MTQPGSDKNDFFKGQKKKSFFLGAWTPIQTESHTRNKAGWQLHFAVHAYCAFYD